MTKVTRDQVEQLLDRMDRLTRELIGTLDNLVRIGERKQKALVAMEMPSVQDAIQEEEGQLQVFVSLQTHRLQTFGDLATALGINPEGLNLEQLAQALGEPMSTELLAMRDAVLERTRLLERVTRLNRVLTEQSMAHVDGFLKALATAIHASPTYGHRGKRSDTGGGNLVIDQVA